MVKVEVLIQFLYSRKIEKVQALNCTQKIKVQSNPLCLAEPTPPRNVINVI